MLDLDTHLRYLALAEAHLRGGGQRIVQMQALISQGRSLGIDVSSAERVLGAMEDALAVMAEHRESIAAKIDAMHRGLM